MRFWIARWDGESFFLEWKEVDEIAFRAEVGRIRAFIAKQAFTRYSMAGITLYPYVIVRGDYNPASNLLLVRHEFVHLIQQKEGRMRFYAKYVFQWFINYVRYRKIIPAYYEISYEQEARRISSDRVEFEQFLKKHRVKFSSV